jgi:tight adherence protein B
MLDGTFILIASVFVSIAAIAIFVLAGPNTSKAQKRRFEAVRDRVAPSNEAALAAQMRRTIAARLPSQDAGIGRLLPNQEKMALRLRRTGKDWTLSTYLWICLGIAAVIIALMMLQGAPLLLSLLMGIGIGLGAPHMVVGHLIKKRLNEFIMRFPDAIDLLVRGLRSGLPIAETLAAVSSEVPGPVGVEFRQIIERIRIGKTMEAALQDTADLLDIPEFQFFCITLSIQRETGGNLAETLANLSEVLRKRAQMKLKIRAMSSEAKASAWIVGSLPFFVFALVTFMNPDYTAPFMPWSEFYDQRVMISGIIGLIWMSIGVAIMAKMISFEI